MVGNVVMVSSSNHAPFDKLRVTAVTFYEFIISSRLFFPARAKIKLTGLFIACLSAMF
jgi:hypothetical protein